MTHIISKFARFATKPKSGNATFVNATGANAYGTSTNVQQVYAPDAAHGGILVCLFITTTDTVNNVVNFYLKKAGVYIPIGAFSIPANSGSNGTVVMVDLLDFQKGSHLFLSNQGKRDVEIEPACEIWAGLQSAVTSSKSTFIVGLGLDYED